MKDLIARLRGAPSPDLFATASPADAAVLRGLAQAGADLGKPRRVTHFLVFPAEEPALRAATLVETPDRRVSTEPAGDRRPGAPGWLVSVEHVLVASPRAVDELRREFESVARGLGGTYEGWEGAASP